MLCSFRETAPARPSLKKGEVHVLRFQGREDDATLCESLLSADEIARASLLRFEKDAREFILARGMLRYLLGTYLDRDPKRLAFELNPFGKPFLPSGEISFNLSHSDGLVLYALASGREVGIDVERVAEKPFSFYSEWTYREARVKAAGAGVFEPPPPEALPGWNFLSLFPGEGFASVLAVEGFDAGISFFDWRPVNPPP